jgi:hypothetical protein
MDHSPAQALDLLERDRAADDDAALVHYQAKWQRKLARLQRVYPERFRVAGLSPEEVRDDATLHLVEVVRGDRSAHARYDHPRREWGLCVVLERLSSLRQRFRLDATPVDFGVVAVAERTDGLEERYLYAEHETLLAQAEQRARQSLNGSQRRWLSAMTLAANAGAFFEASDALNLSAASRLLGKNRSSAQRAYRDLQVHFAKARERREQ